MYTYSSPRLVTVRPEMDRLAQYAPGESLEAFSERTGIPIEDIIKLNSNESSYEPAPTVLQALSNFRNYNNYPDANSTALRNSLADYTGVDGRHIVVHHGSAELINLLWHLFLSVGDNVLCCPQPFHSIPRSRPSVARMYWRFPASRAMSLISMPSSMRSLLKPSSLC